MKVVDLILYIGTFVLALTGALKARTHRMDILGGTVLAFVTAYGGGTVRDLLIGIKPVNWMNDYIALTLMAAAVIITFLLKRNIHRFTNTIFLTDAIGLGMFTAGGIERSLSHGVNETYAVLMGVISATFGGLMADIISNTVPALLRRGELYATACGVGGIAYLLLNRCPMNPNVNLFICVAIVVSVRILSRQRKLQLPEI